MVHDLVNYSAQLASVEARESGRYADQSWDFGVAPVSRVSQSEVGKNIEIGWAHNMVSFIDKNELVPRGVKLVQTFARDDALHRGNCDVGGTRRMVVAHLNFHTLIYIGTGAVAGGLFDKFAPVSEDERLGSMTDGSDPVDEVGEDDRLASPCSQ